ncbi:2-deoxy-D-gluconate 3-dehydrogenase [Asanoa ishikariensis]|uniref:3-oxoacyl-[acyl-carrier protein] reductase n=1 Tax=Asanoa ishikariensis TaxID=137265 RepID=A0A1H3UC00_9ACTN|nr:SDR family NAD(P)-dependent oxidoreductase [Asanoa ishikariensis]GIF63873.1 2-deoxy-D-gluconate 3-dehydrogenase [Asanoa ishikariensis]SDZ59983.1 3-oxoacyl-[acyl-carrier protein] reductase [Asanoa ishikariensis]
MNERAPRIDFAGRWALITGGAGGLGSACARAYLAAGGNVVLADLPGDRLDQVAAELRAPGGRVEAIGVDLADVATCRDLPHRAHAFGGRLDTLINATGIMQTKPMAEVTADEWQRVIDINLTGVFHTVQAACGLMAEAGGSVVSIASVAARSGRPAAPAYAASKTALLSLTKSAALAYAPKVRVNAVCPGVFFTDMWRGIVQDRDREYGPGAGQRYLDEVTAKTPLQRLGTVEELAAVVAFLASDLAAYITGQAVNVDGGLEMD